jgi:hypothetical protein
MFSFYNENFTRWKRVTVVGAVKFWVSSSHYWFENSVNFFFFFWLAGNSRLGPGNNAWTVLCSHFRYCYSIASKRIDTCIRIYFSKLWWTACRYWCSRSFYELNLHPPPPRHRQQQKIPSHRPGLCGCRTGFCCTADTWLTVYTRTCRVHIVYTLYSMYSGSSLQNNSESALSSRSDQLT